MVETRNRISGSTHVGPCLWIMDPHSRVPKKNTSHGNEALPQDNTHLIQRPCYQRGSPWQDPAGSRTIRRPSDHRKETQTVVVWSCIPFIRSGQNHRARHSERGEEDRQKVEEVGRQHKRMDRQVREGNGEQRKMERPKRLMGSWRRRWRWSSFRWKWQRDRHSQALSIL